MGNAKDAIDSIRKCEQCHISGLLLRRIHVPAEPFKALSAPCIFVKYGMDIVGLFPAAQGQRKFLLVEEDYYRKWVEVESLTKITETEVLKFMWENIVCRYGIPSQIIFDNGRQFQGWKIQDWCADLSIQQRFTTVAYPQANG
ncbi:UNVERIFIED_CONTAM: hypothetical protein Slati_1758500 [Sesamum latifolium]|uniref:Integrase catalytic domain-containing protein n=1 Tax=Sesamum latifolium TaxID=2727402 RepID=A0AAW2X2L1_9LAMI